MKAYQFKQLDETSVELSIYGDLTSMAWSESDVSSYDFKAELKENDNKNIIVRINSYGGEVAQGLAIYNLLKAHKGAVTTVVDGFACSAASIVFMAGDKRIIPDTALLMIHNAWSFASGNANELRKVADDLEKVTEPSIKAYKKASNLSEEEIRNMLDNETWITADEAKEYGFATSVEKTEKNSAATQSLVLKDLVMKNRLLKQEVEKDTEEESNETVELSEEQIESIVDRVIERLEEKSEEDNKDDEENKKDNEEDVNKTDDEEKQSVNQMLTSFFN